MRREEDELKEAVKMLAEHHAEDNDELGIAARLVLSPLESNLMGDTPRTDAATATPGTADGWSVVYGNMRDHARQLERELEQYKRWADYACKRFHEETGKDLQAQGG